MMTAQEINLVLLCLQESLKGKIPGLKDPSVLSVEGIRMPGTFGSLILSVLLVGDIDAKLTLILEWETATKLASKILKLEKSDAFNEDQQLAIEEVVNIAGENIATQFSQSGRKVESILLPTLLESNVLLSFHPSAEIIKIGIQTIWDPISLYIAVPKPVEAQSAA